MDRESVDRLRFDRRFANRRDWVEASDRDAFVESLPDVSGKMTTAAELEAEKEAAAPVESSPEPAAEPTFGGPTSVGGGGFGGDGGSFGG
jgi:hypothetical protein